MKEDNILHLGVPLNPRKIHKDDLIPIQNSAIREAQIAILEQFRDHLLEAFEPTSLGFTLTVPEINQTIAELKGGDHASI